MSVVELLQKCGAYLESDEKNNCYLKSCFYYGAAAQKLVKSTVRFCSLGVFTEFYHNDCEEKTSQKVNFYRLRTQCADGTEQQTKFVSEEKRKNMLQRYEVSSRQLDKNECKFMTSYSFTRDVYWDVCNRTFFVDTLLEPQYAIMTVSIKISFNPVLSPCENLQRQLNYFTNFKLFPAFTKFMYILQCFSLNDLYDSVYASHDPTKLAVAVAVNKILDDVTLLVEHRDYLWFVHSQIVHAQTIL
jgi:hypothetical protein